ncbi:glycosyltransferase [Salinimonas marina]|uniref:Glycosyltransferase n=1 Tax=Salinimonas marina TaxID=2785918 RepID=A0A7S9DVG1_9ALTE|nr:glycosyltransferase [Salinimonas marina]QPG04577.1 glycosyltransferase [Salinimonas marina]
MAAPAKLSAIFVTYKMKDALLERVAQFKAQFPDSQVIVADNSPLTYKKYAQLNSALQCFADTEYIDNSINSRFCAYNLACAKIKHDNVVFRTDDDKFDEAVLRALLEAHPVTDFAVTPHYFNNDYQMPVTWERPIEGVIFGTDFLKSLLPFTDEKGADWSLLKTAFDKKMPQFLNQPVLFKSAHGRVH